jgi:hypothetical protein
MHGQVDSVVICIGSALAVLPLLLVIAYLALGRQKRIDELKSYVRPSVAVGEVGASTESDSGSELLAAHLARKYKETHGISAYIAALGVFYVVYGVLMYWSFLAWGRELASDGQGVQQSPALWLLVRTGAAGALGATLSALWHLYWRVIRLDLQARTLLHLSARLSISPFLAVTLVALLPLPSTSAPLVAFGAGLLGDEALRRIVWLWRQLTGLAQGSTAALPLRMIQGITTEDELRLWEEGISDAQHLAVETVVTLITNTKYSLERIVDWKDQAILYSYVGDDIVKWRSLNTRAALDVLGMAPEHYSAAGTEQLVASLAKTLAKDPAVLVRFIDTVYQDPHVNQLWAYVCHAYPSTLAKPLRHSPTAERRSAGPGGSLDAPSSKRETHGDSAAS